jgi:predicted O-methyltransferase YrrM
MSETLTLPQVQNVLERLHTLADANDESAHQRVHCAPTFPSADARQKAHLLRDVLMPVSRDAGRFLYGVARATAAKRIVEFGTSFGISTIYFTAALRDNGGGRLIGSELEPTKVIKATQHLTDAGLSEFAEIRTGDARETLRDVGGPIDILFLDGWKELYLDLLHRSAANLRPGSVVLADDVTLFPDAMAEYLAYVRDPANGFISVYLPIDDGIEYSVQC